MTCCHLLFFRQLTSALGVRTLLLHGQYSIVSLLLISKFCLHVGLAPVLLPAMGAALVPTVAIVGVFLLCPPMNLRTAAMFLDLSLSQQACGLPSAKTSLVLLVLPIKLLTNPQTNSMSYLAQGVIGMSSIHS